MIKKDNLDIFWQFHQSTNEEMPQNTMAAFLYAWNLGGIPELDIRTTKDGVIIAFHDDTPQRTAVLDDSLKNKNISEFTFNEITRWDVGASLNIKYAGEKVPSVEETFLKMKGHPERLVYLDLKDVDLCALSKLIKDYKVERQVIFTHKNQQNCITMKKYSPSIRTMLWIGGTAEGIKEKFYKAMHNRFEGLDQVQLHLNDKADINGWRYQLDIEFVKYAVQEVTRCDLDLEVLPFKFDKETLHMLLDFGIRWYATDEPKRFLQDVNEWRKKQIGNKV